MKKTIAILSAILFLATPAAFASNDLSKMTVDELIKLRTQIETELVSRKEVKSFSIPQGTYIAGDDFPAGVYRVTLDGNPMVPIAALVVKDPNSTNTVGDLYSISPSVGTAEIGKLVLKEGMSIEVSGPNLLFTVYTGIGF